MGFFWTLEQKIKVGSKCFANLTGVSGTISHYLLAANMTSFAVLFTASSSHVAYHGILDELGSFAQSKSRIISFRLRLIRGQISLRVVGDSEGVY